MEEKNEDHYRFRPRTQADSSGRDRCPPHSGSDKEAVFSAIHFEVEGARMLDLFAGTGQMGLEAISRGAKSVTFVESGRPSLEALRANIAACGFTEQCKVFAMDALRFLKIGGGEYDVAFIDPPYNKVGSGCAPIGSPADGFWRSDPVRD